MAYALEINQLCKRYPPNMNALDNVSLTVEEGDFFALLGPNGAGKSTLINIISSLVKKDAGKVAIFGTDIDTDFPLARQSLGIVPQEFNFNTFEKCRDILIYQAGYYGLQRAVAAERADVYLTELGLWEKRYTPTRFLSGGMKRRLMIARALIHQPKLLVLDEPTAGVDIELRRTMWSFIKKINEQGTTIILTTHYLEEAESLCRNVAIIDGGKIVTRSSMQHLLSGLQRESFVLDLDRDGQTIQLDAQYDMKILDGGRIEVSLEKGQDLSQIFCRLSEQGFRVTSMRNKVNRLEELFVGMIANTSNAKNASIVAGENI